MTLVVSCFVGTILMAARHRSWTDFRLSWTRGSLAWTALARAAFRALSLPWGGLSMAREAMLRTDEPFGVSLVTGFLNNDDGSATYMSIVCVVREDDVLDEACIATLQM